MLCVVGVLFVEQCLDCEYCDEQVFCDMQVGKQVSVDYYDVEYYQYCVCDYYEVCGICVYCGQYVLMEFVLCDGVCYEYDDWVGCCDEQYDCGQIGEQQWVMECYDKKLFDELRGVFVMVVLWRFDGLKSVVLGSIMCLGC